MKGHFFQQSRIYHCIFEQLAQVCCLLHEYLDSFLKELLRWHHARACKAVHLNAGNAGIEGLGNTALAFGYI